jgi:hypothetical protein
MVDNNACGHERYVTYCILLLLSLNWFKEFFQMFSLNQRGDETGTDTGGSLAGEDHLKMNSNRTSLTLVEVVYRWLTPEPTRISLNCTTIGSRNVIGYEKLKFKLNFFFYIVASLTLLFNFIRELFLLFLFFYKLLPLLDLAFQLRISTDVQLIGLLKNHTITKGITPFLSITSAVALRATNSLDSKPFVAPQVTSRLTLLVCCCGRTR